MLEIFYLTSLRMTYSKRQFLDLYLVIHLLQGKVCLEVFLTRFNEETPRLLQFYGNRELYTSKGSMELHTLLNWNRRLCTFWGNILLHEL